MLRKMVIVAGTIAFALFAAATGRAADDGAVAAVKAAEQRMSQAFAKKDIAAIKQLSTPDHVAVMPSYRHALNLDQMLASLADTKVAKVTLENVAVRPLSDDAVLVTSIKSYQGTYKGKPLPARVYATAIWVKRDGAWRTTFYQETAFE